MHRFALQYFPFLLVTAPPRHGKTEILSRKLPGYVFGTFPHARIIAASYAATPAERINRELQRIIMSDSYKRVFPHIALNERNIRTVADGSWLRNSEMFEIVNTRSYYKCAGIGGAATGMGFTHGIVDDFLKDYKDASSAVVRETQWDWFRSVFLTRRARNACIAATVTRWNHDDIIGRLIKHMKKIGKSHLLTVLDYPAIMDRDPSWYDPRERGQALWESEFPIENMRETEDIMGTRIFQALYQQNPTALEGDIVKRDWFMDNLYQPADLPDHFDLKCISVDATFDDKKKKKGSQNDFVVMQCWGKKGKHKYLLDQVRDRMNFTRSLHVLAEFHSKNSEHQMVDAVWVEEAANGPAIIATMREHIDAVTPVQTHGMSKVARLEAEAPQIETGQVHFPANAPWLGTSIEEIIEFPNGSNDDVVDALSQALKKMKSRLELPAEMEDMGASKQSSWRFDQLDPMDYGAGDY